MLGFHPSVWEGGQSASPYSLEFPTAQCHQQGPIKSLNLLHLKIKQQPEEKWFINPLECIGHLWISLAPSAYTGRLNFIKFCYFSVGSMYAFLLKEMSVYQGCSRGNT